jgi:hypothetical protein
VVLLPLSGVVLVLSGAVLSFLCFFDFFASEEDWSVVEELLPVLVGAVPVVSEGFELGCGAVVWSLLLGVLGLVLGVLGLVLGELLGCCEGCCMLPLDCATAIAPVNRIAQNSFVNFDIKKLLLLFPARFYDAGRKGWRVAGWRKVVGQN